MDLQNALWIGRLDPVGLFGDGVWDRKILGVWFFAWIERLRV